MKKACLITSNPEKVEAARKAFRDTEIQLQRKDAPHPEIQASSSLEVARHTVEKALENSDKPVIREDHSLYLDAIPGFPGPYISYFDENLDAEELIELIRGKERTGYFEIATVLGFPDGEIREYEFQVDIELAEEPRGEQENFSRILKMRGSDKTFAESDSLERIDTWNRNFRKIAEELI